MSIAQEFGNRVREMRKRRGLTLEELAAACGERYSMQRIGEIERGRTNCTLETIHRLSTGLACEPAELFIFDPKAVGERLTQLDARLLDFWNGADEQTRAKAIRILSELT